MSAKLEKPSPGPAPRAPDSAAPGAPSPQAQAAAGLVTALAKAARALTLYDAGNDLARQFMTDCRERAAAATSGGPLELEVGPAELTLGGEVVYREEDRERSLAFKFFRDGVRRLTFHPGVNPGEVQQLVQVLALRLVGVKQAEDDVVTLLRRADLRGITVAAIEGYASQEEAPGAAQRRLGGEPPADWDTPFPRLPAPGPIAFAPVAEEALQALRAEEEPPGLGRSALALAAELLAWAARGAVPMREVAQYCAELRDFLVHERQLELLSALADLAQRQPPGPGRDDLLRTLAHPALLELLLAAAPAEAAALPAEASRLTALVPAAAVLDRLAGETSPSHRSLLLGVVGARLPADAEAVLDRLRGAPAELARALSGLLVQRAPQTAGRVWTTLLGHSDPDLQIRALRALADSSEPVPPGRLVELLASPQEMVRVSAAEALEVHGDTAAAKAVAEALTGRRSFPRAEAAALGRTLGALHAGAALRLFLEWLRPRSKLLGALRGGGEHEELLRWAAVSGLSAIEGREAEAQLQVAAGWADGDLRRHVAAALARRRAEGGGHG